MDNNKPATKKDVVSVKKDIQELRSETKKDIQELRSETKKDIQELKIETKKDIQKHRSETKQGNKALKDDIRALRRDVLRNEERTEVLEEGQKRIEVKLDKLQNTLDSFVGGVDELRVENSVGTHQTRQLQLKTDDHEKRIKNLEASKN